MENSVKRNKSFSALMAILLLAAGGVLSGFSLHMLPGAPAYGFPWELLGVIVSFVLIAAGGGCLGSFVHYAGRENYRHDSRGSMIFVIFVIIAGIILLCFNFGALPAVWRRVFFSWQMLLLVFGAAEISRRRFIGGGILFAVGGFFIIRLLVPIYPMVDAGGNIGAMYWPAMLIILGVLLLCGMIFRPGMRGCRGHRRHGHYCGHRKGQSWSDIPHGSGLADISVVFGSSEQLFLDPVFRGGKISSVFGGVVLDLRRAELPEGDTYLKVESVFGGIEIFAPAGWRIEIRNESVFGGFADKRLSADRNTYDDGRRLIIRASNVFGGGDIK